MRDDEFNKNIGTRIREQREYMGLTREGLCGRVSISPQFLSEIERGVKGPSAEMLAKLCKGLGLSADYALNGVEQMSDTSRITQTLAMLPPEQVEIAEEMLKLFFKAVNK